MSYDVNTGAPLAHDSLVILMGLQRQMQRLSAPVGVPVHPPVSGTRGYKKFTPAPNVTRRPSEAYRRATAGAPAKTGFTRFSNRQIQGRSSQAVLTLAASGIMNAGPRTGVWGKRVDVPTASPLTPLQRRTEGYFKRLQQDRAAESAALTRKFDIVRHRRTVLAHDVADQTAHTNTAVAIQRSGVSLHHVPRF